MTWQENYLPPNIEADKLSAKLIWKKTKRIFVVLIHSLRFHKDVQNPRKSLPEIDANAEKIYDLSKNIYEESIQRIEKLEEKSFKLLSYYTILFGLVSFVVLESNISFWPKLLILISLSFIVWSVVISFRCLNIKGISKIYLLNIFNFEEDSPKQNIKTEEIIRGYLDSAVKNDTVANNTVDLLRAARYSLIIAAIVFFVAIGIAVYKGQILNKSNYNSVNDNFKKVTEKISSIEKNINKQNQIIDEQMGKMNNSLDAIIRSYKRNKSK